MLEMLLVIALASSIVLLSLRFGQRYRWHVAYEQVQQSVQQVMLAADVYFHEHCRDGYLPKTLTLEDLEKDGALADKRAVSNPWGGVFSVEIDTQQHPVQLQVSARFNRLPGTDPSLSHYRRLLAATGEHDILRWSQPPGQINARAVSPLWIAASSLPSYTVQMDARYKQSLCFNEVAS